MILNPKPAPKKNIGKSGQPYAGGRLHGRIWLNICEIRPPAADNLDDKSIVSEKAAQIYPDLLEPISLQPA